MIAGGVAKAEEEEMFIPPLVAPTLPARFYFKYGQAIETNRSDSREHLDGVYRQVLPCWCCPAGCADFGQCLTAPMLKDHKL